MKPVRWLKTWLQVIFANSWHMCGAKRRDPDRPESGWYSCCVKLDAHFGPHQDHAGEWK